MQATTIFGFAICATLMVAGYSFAAESTGFQVLVYDSKSDDCRPPERIPEDAQVLFDDSQVSELIWEEQTFVLSKTATDILMVDIARLEEESSEDFVPRGKFPEAEGRAFVLVLNGAIVGAGRVAGMELLQDPPDCPLLYPAFPMVREGRLAVAVGKPRREDELREDFFKVLIEEGPQACFAPGLDPIVREFFQMKGKAK